MSSLEYQDRLLPERATRIGIAYSLGAALVLILCISIMRFPRIISPQELNVDESQMLSQGMKFLVDPIPWRAVDGTSSGPLNSYLVSLLLLLGFRPGYVLVHLLANALVCLQVLTAHRTLLRLSDGSKTAAACGVVPMIFYYGFTDIKDYLHYSSELLPALLLALGFHAFVVWLEDRPDAKPSSQSLLLALAGLALGAVPFCKLQATPIAAALSVTVLAAISSGTPLPRGRSHRVTQAAAFCAGALVPAIAILSLVIRAGVIRDFWYSYVLGNIAYAGPQNWTRMYYHLTWLVSPAGMRPLFVLDALAIFLFVCYGYRNDRLLLRARELWVFGGSLLYAGAALFAVSRPAIMFPHYTIFLVHPLTYLGVGLLSKELPWLRFKSRESLGVLYKLVVIAVAIIMPAQVVAGITAMRNLRRPQPDSNERIAAVIQQMQATRPIASLAIWGWAPGVYVLTGMPPATRDAIGHFVISKGPMQGYFRERFARDLREKLPDLFIDAVAPGAFMWFWKETDGYESEPRLKSFVDDNYVLVAELALRPGSKPVRFFARREFSRPLIQLSQWP